MILDLLTTIPETATVGALVRFYIGSNNVTRCRSNPSFILRALRGAGAPGAFLVHDGEGWHPQYGREGASAVDVFIHDASKPPRHRSSVEAWARETAATLARECEQDSVGYTITPALAGLVTARGGMLLE